MGRCWEGEGDAVPICSTPLPGPPAHNRGELLPHWGHPGHSRVSGLLGTRQRHGLSAHPLCGPLPPPASLPAHVPQGPFCPVCCAASPVSMGPAPTQASGPAAGGLLAQRQAPKRKKSDVLEGLAQGAKQGTIFHDFRASKEHCPGELRPGPPSPALTSGAALDSAASASPASSCLSPEQLLLSASSPADSPAREPPPSTAGGSHPHPPEGLAQCGRGVARPSQGWTLAGLGEHLLGR